VIKRAILTLCLLMLTAGLASSQAPSGCTWETARAVSVRMLDGAPARWAGACVRVRGELDYRSLSQTRRERLTVIERTSIGAYFANDTLTSLAGRWQTPRRVEALGTVGLCRNICADANHDAVSTGVSGGSVTTVTICLPTGWCHSYDDPYVLIASIRY
jgi:hypothetical protein